MNTSRVFVSLLLFALFLGGCGQVTENKKTSDEKNIQANLPDVKSFEECISSGLGIRGYDPDSCTLPGKGTFYKETATDQDNSDLIVVESPEANATVASPLTVSGKARGSWYFEAVFPVELVDSNGNLIAQVNASATEDWMTEEFVPFTATLDFQVPEGVTEGKLIFRNDNPSGLPENDKEISIPVKFGKGK